MSEYTIPETFENLTPRELARMLKRDVWAMTDGRCYYCGLHTNPFATYSVDHIYPRSKGGSNHISNLVPCCRRCNSSKGSRLLDEWTPRRPFWFLSDEYQDIYAVRRAVVIDDWVYTYLWEDDDESEGVE